MDLLRGITGGGVTWTLEFDGGRTEFRPGEVVRGYAIVAAERDLDARRLMAALVGEERFQYTEMERSRDGTRSTSRWGSEELGRFELQLAGPIRLTAGQSLRLPFSFPLPPGAPPSFESPILTSRWEVRAWADTGGRDPSEDVRIRVHAAVTGSEPATRAPAPVSAAIAPVLATAPQPSAATSAPDPVDRTAIDSLLGASGPAFGVEGLATERDDVAPEKRRPPTDPVAPDAAFAPAAPPLAGAGEPGAPVAAHPTDPRWQVEPRPLVAGEPFRAVFRPAEPLSGSTRVELRLEVATTESGGLPISLILAEGFGITSTGRRGKHETVVLWRGELAEQPQPDGSRGYAIAGEVPAGSTPTVVLPHGWARAYLDIVVERRLRRDEHETLEVPIVTTR